MDELHLKDIFPCLENARFKMKKEYIRVLLQNASGTDIPYKSETFAKKVLAKFNKKAKKAIGIHNWWMSKKAIPSNKLKLLIKLSSASFDELESNIISIRAGIKKGEVKIKFPLEYTYELGNIAGHILGDGSIDKKHTQVFFTNTNRSLLEEFRSHVRSLFAIEPRIWIQTRGYGQSKWIRRINTLDEMENYQVGLFYPKICGLILNQLLDNFALGKEKNITPVMKEASIDFKKGLIRALFDDEGCVDEGSQMIRFSQDREEIITGLKEILTHFNIESKPQHQYLKGGKIRRYFNITGIKNHYLYYNYIGFTCKYKREALEKMIRLSVSSRRYKNLELPKINNILMQKNRSDDQQIANNINNPF